MDNNQFNDDVKEDGKVWTSYSDMFTTMAIIFLVMFVFALIKTGVSTAQNAQETKSHKEELEGKLSKKDKEQEIENKKLIESKLNKFSQYKNIIDKKITSLNEFALTMEESENFLKKMVDAQTKKESILKNLQDKYKKQIAEISELKRLKKAQAEFIKDQKKEKEEISDNYQFAIQQKDKLIKKYKKNLSEKMSRLDQTKKRLDQQITKNSELSEITQQKEELINEHTKKIVQNHKTIYYQQKDLKNKTKMIKQLNAGLSKQKAQISKKITEIKKIKLDKTMLINEISNKQIDIKKLSMFNNNTNHRLKKIQLRKEKLEKKIAKYEKKINLDEAIKKDAIKTANSAKDSIHELEEKLASAQREVKNLEGENQSLETKFLATVDAYKKLTIDNNENIKTTKNLGQNFSKSIEASQKEIKKLKSEKINIKGKFLAATDHLKKISMKNHKNNEYLKFLKNQLSESDKTLAALEKKLKGKTTAGSDKITFLEEKLSKLEHTKDQLKKGNGELENRLGKIGRKIASVSTNLRGKIANDLAKKFKSEKINAVVNPQTGNVTLEMADNFLFNKGSAKLNIKAQKRLSKLIPIYAKVLFEDQDIREKIASFNIEGHASPTFDNKCVDPDFQNFKAYNFNMELSSQRASSITSYIFGKEIGEFDFKYLMRNLTKATGRGYQNPILINNTNSRMPASIIERCGPYDVKRSQRVELNFALKDDIEQIKKLLQLKRNIE